MAFSSFNTFSALTVRNSGILQSSVSYLLKNASVTSSYGITQTVGSYTIYQLNSTPISTLSFASGSTIYILSVAGGGGGGNSDGGGGGGGAGGFVQQTITLSSVESLTISIGQGGVANNNGTNTTVNFTNKTSNNIASIGGGAGGIAFAKGSSGGSGGGNGRDSGPLVGGSGTANQGQNGGTTNTSGWSGASGGGGAELIGGYGGNSSNTNGGSSSQQYCGNGGDGKLCTLNGISDLYPTQYWAGGGGGSVDNKVNVANNTIYGTKNTSPNTIGIAASATTSGIAGIGGFGGGGGGGNNVNSGSGNGGINTGGGGGGAFNSAGSGGSGIVIVAILTSSLNN